MQYGTSFQIYCESDDAAPSNFQGYLKFRQKEFNFDITITSNEDTQTMFIPEPNVFFNIYWQINSNWTPKSNVWMEVLHKYLQFLYFYCQFRLRRKAVIQISLHLDLHIKHQGGRFSLPQITSQAGLIKLSLRPPKNRLT